MSLHDETAFRHETWNGSESVVLENDTLRVRLLPAIGGKLCSLVRRDRDLEFLLQPPRPARGLQTAGYGAPFELFDTSGFDECFPTVASCRYPEQPWLGVSLPDHGELWSIPWSCRLDGPCVLLEATGRVLPYRFRKRVSLENESVRLAYELTNLGSEAFAYLWSAHPLLSVSPGDRLFLPSQVSEVELAWSRAGRLGQAGDRIGWPVASVRDGRQLDLSILRGPSEGTAEKLFTPPLETGVCALYKPREERSLVFLWDARAAPHLGLWSCHGGWPESVTPRDFTVALEPCTGRPDSLEDAHGRGECARIRGGTSVSWELELRTVTGSPGWIPGLG